MARRVDSKINMKCPQRMVPINPIFINHIYLLLLYYIEQIVNLQRIQNIVIYLYLIFTTVFINYLLRLYFATHYTLNSYGPLPKNSFATDHSLNYIAFMLLLYFVSKNRRFLTHSYKILIGLLFYFSSAPRIVESYDKISTPLERGVSSLYFYCTLIFLDYSLVKVFAFISLMCKNKIQTCTIFKIR